MLVDFYKVAMFACIQALIPNKFTVNNLPDHQQMYIIQGATKACQRELKSERLLACSEDQQYCLDIEE